MRVKVDKIKSEPIEVEENIPGDSWDIDSENIVFADPVHIVSKFVKKSDFIYVKAVISAKREIICSRCLEQSKQAVNFNFNKMYSLDSLGEYLDIDSDLREEVLVNFPMKVLCRPDCEGLCPNCGVNLNLEKCKCK